VVQENDHSVIDSHVGIWEELSCSGCGLPHDFFLNRSWHDAKILAGAIGTIAIPFEGKNQ
jgi:hypothetical protein